MSPTPNSSALSLTVRTPATPSYLNGVRADALAAFQIEIKGGDLITDGAAGFCDSGENVKTFLNSQLCRVNKFEKGEFGQAVVTAMPDIWVPGTITGTIKQICFDLNVIDLCDAAWTAKASVTATADAAVKFEGAASAKLVCAAAFGTGLAATHDFGAQSLTAAKYVCLWVYSTVALNAGDWQLALDDTAACASPVKTYNLPAIAANTWTMVELAAGDMSGCGAIISVGLIQAVDKGAMTLYADYIGWTGQVRWGVQMVCIGTGESVDPAFGSTVEPAAGDIRYYKETDVAVSAVTIGGTPAAGEKLRIQFYRKNAVGDTHGTAKVCFSGAKFVFGRGA